MDFGRNDSVNERDSGDNAQLARAELLYSAGGKSTEDAAQLDGLSQSNNVANRSSRFAELLCKVEANIAQNKLKQAATLGPQHSGNPSLGSNARGIAGNQTYLGAGGLATTNVHQNLTSQIKQMMYMNNPGHSSESGGGVSGLSPSLNAVARPADSSLKAQKYQKRVEKILNRLNDMQVDIEKDKQGKLMSLDKQLGQTDGSLVQWQEANLKKFADFKLKVNECLRYIENDKQAQQYEHEMQIQEITQLEKSIEERFHAEKLARKEMEARLLQQVEEKFLTVRKTLSQESRNRYESIEQLKGSLENDMPRLQELIASECEQREQRDQGLFAKIDQEVRQCVEGIEQERKQREETEEAVLEVIKDMTSKIKQEILDEHREREENFETLLNLLEDKQLQNF